MARNDRARSDWIRETQMFQRIAGRDVDSDEELGAEWDSIYGKKSRALQSTVAENAKIQRVILEQAAVAGRARKN